MSEFEQIVSRITHFPGCEAYTFRTVKVPEGERSLQDLRSCLLKRNVLSLFKLSYVERVSGPVDLPKIYLRVHIQEDSDSLLIPVDFEHSTLFLVLKDLKSVEGYQQAIDVFQAHGFPVPNSKLPLRRTK